PFDMDMSLHTPGIADMLREYAQDHQLAFDANEVAQSIYDYTHGYPFLVSRLCQLIEQNDFSWNAAGVVNAVHELLNERNTLFDDLIWEYEHNPKQKTVRPADNRIFETRIQNHLELEQQLFEILNRSVA
ncbi:MAG: hypothetical protein KBT27_05280, partial [Prevotellaceae bacterium]|nr:hypothetical protein [Candidatus Faecinaster equi]